MDRLEQQADDLASQNDPEGAALAIGKAAMMADLLTADSQAPAASEMYQAASLLFRAQEQSLRALALFEQAGGTPPAATGACQHLAQAHQKLADSKDLLDRTPSVSPEEIKVRGVELLQKNEEWQNLIQILHEDFACADTVNKK